MSSNRVPHPKDIIDKYIFHQQQIEAIIPLRKFRKPDVEVKTARVREKRARNITDYLISYGYTIPTLVRCQVLQSKKPIL